ncbi:MAG TPA: protein kinase [Gemmatimonadaceae bacterium]|jgi:Tol biopolymer transport system component
MQPISRWLELSTLVDRMLDTPPEARSALIDALSVGDATRRAELEALRAECERPSSPVSVPLARRFAALLGTDGNYPDALQERYRLTRTIGRGGMATVFLARDVRHARDVAVKVMHPYVGITLGAERFLAEIEMVAQMHHPHIVPLYDSGEADGALYYVMPYEPGLSLRDRLARENRLAAGEVVLLLRELCDALAYAHARGIVHRDIKPDNVLLSGRHALLADFGVATALGSKTGSAASFALGTPTYMAPEQFAGNEGVDHRADVYAVGVLGYELLAGRPPFAGDTRQAVIDGHLQRKPEAVGALEPGVPPALDAFVMRCLEKRPGDRWDSADRMVRELEIMTAKLAWRAARPNDPWRDRWASMHIERITDFAGSEVDAEISRDGRRVAFLADRDGVFDAHVTDVGSGQFLNLTGGRCEELFNEDVRNVGFTPDGSHLWLRVADLTSPASVSVIPVTGGDLRPFLPTAVMAAWSPDGSRLAYHEASPGDPIFVANASGDNPRRIQVASPGVHSHHLSWSPDARFLYCSHGLPPNEMDIWRLPADGGSLERITEHRSRVGFPVLLDDSTLLYTATDEDGTGPWLYMMDLGQRVPMRLNVGVEHFLSIAASAKCPGRPRRLVGTVSKPSVQLWSVPIASTSADEASAARFSVPTARAAAPRYAPDSSLLYLASRGGADELWRRSGTDARMLWKPGQGAIAGAAAMSPDGEAICVVVRRGGRSALHCMREDGSGLRPLAQSLDVRGAPSWSPDGKWIAIGARDGHATHVYIVPLGEGEPVLLVDSVSSNPVWSPRGTYILYSGTARGRSVPVHGVRPDGTPFPLPLDNLVVDRVGDSYRFLPDGAAVVVKLGGFRRQDFWLLDLHTGARRQLTKLKPGQSLNRFDVSSDGRTILFERAQENSDVALIEIEDE